MKSIVKENNNTEPKFPALYKNNNNGKVVLFTDKVSGVIVRISKYPADQIYPNEQLGYFSNDWIECTSEKCWEKLSPGLTVELVQE